MGPNAEVHHLYAKIKYKSANSSKFVQSTSKITLRTEANNSADNYSLQQLKQSFRLRHDFENWKRLVGTALNTINTTL